MKKLFSLGIVAVLFVAVVALATPVTSTPETNNYTLILYDGHMHTTFSDGNGTVSDIVATAKSRGLNAVIITDHSEDLTADEWNWLVGNCTFYTNETFLCLPGFEMTGSESIFMRDHFNVYNVSTPFVTDDLVASQVWPSPFNPTGTGPLSPENITHWVDWAHSLGGIVVHNHPSGHTKTAYGVDLIEIWNQGFIDEINAVGESIPPPLGGPYYGAGYIINNLTITGERDLTPELRNAIHVATQYVPPYVGIWFGAPEDPLNSWGSFLRNYTIGGKHYVAFAVGGTDSHNTGDPDSTVGLAKTGVYAESFTANDLYEGIKKGRSFVTTGPIISFNVSGVMMGETLLLEGGVIPMLNIKIESSAPSANIIKVTIIKNGLAWQTFSPNLPSFEAHIEDSDGATNSYYRIEVVENDTILGETHFAYSNPIFAKLPSWHDVATLRITPSKTVIGQGYPANISITIENQGTYTETFNVTVYANTTLIHTFLDVTLTSGNFTTITFPWDTGGYAMGIYTISANTTVPNDIDATDNTCIYGTVKVVTPGDINGDGHVNLLDLSLLADHWFNLPHYDAGADINGNGFTNIGDLSILADYWFKGPLD